MPTAKQRAEQKRIASQYRRRGFGKSRSAFIAKAVVYGVPRRKPSSKKRR